jgi:hypothetical protein
MKRAKSGLRKAEFASSTTSDTFGVRGAGMTWQPSFGKIIQESDLFYTAERDSIGNKITFQFAHDIFDNWFEVEEVSDKPDPKFNEAVQEVLSRLAAKEIFTNMAIFERIYGWAIIALTYIDYGKDVSEPVENPKEILDLIAFSSDSFRVDSSDEDKDVDSRRFGLPIHYTVTRGGQGTQTKLHYTRVIHAATRLLDHPYKGRSVLEPVYDDVSILKNMLWGAGQTVVRYGGGFPDITVEGAKKNDLDKIAADQNFRALHSRSYFLHNDKMTLEFKGAAGRALNPEPYYTMLMENISAGCGIPLAMLRGVNAGQLTGSEVNERQYFKLVSDAQSRFEPAIRELIDRLIECGQIRFKWNVNRGYRIKWLGGFEMSEMDKANVQLRLAQARSWATDWKTIDELRAEENLSPLPKAEEGGTVLGVAGLRQKTQAGMTKEVDVLPSPTAGADSVEEEVRNGLMDRIKRRLRL